MFKTLKLTLTDRQDKTSPTGKEYLLFKDDNGVFYSFWFNDDEDREYGNKIPLNEEVSLVIKETKTEVEMEDGTTKTRSYKNIVRPKQTGGTSGVSKAEFDALVSRVTKLEGDMLKANGEEK